MRTICRFASLTLLLPTLLLAQQAAPSASAPSSSVMTLHVTRQIVVLDLVVTDKHGNLVTNCTANDFKVYENGVLQNISNFEPPQSDRKLPAVALKDHNGRDNWGNAPLTMLVIDEMNTPFSEMAYSRYEVNRFLKAQPALMPEPTMVLWLNDSGFHPLTSFTRDREALLTAVVKHNASLPSKLMRGDAVARLAESFSALQQIALFSRGSRAGKKIIWIGRGFPGVNVEQLSPHDQDTFNKAVHSTLDLLLASRASVDVIDPTEMLNPEPNATIGDETPNLPDDPTLLTAAPADPFAASFNFSSFSRQTGGQYFYGRNDIDREIATSASHANSFYTLTYSPSAPIEDNTYRKIVVRMSNPNLVVQTKQGYYPGGDDQSAPTKKELGFDLYEASVTGMVYTGVGLHLDHCARDRDRIHADCTLSFDSGTLSFAPTDSGSYSTKFVASVSSLDAKSKLVYWTVDQITLGVGSSQVNRIANGRGTFDVHTVIPPQAKAVRFIVRDSSGRIGTADLPPQQISSLSASMLAIQELKREHRRR